MHWWFRLVLLCSYSQEIPTCPLVTVVPAKNHHWIVIICSKGNSQLQAEKNKNTTLSSFLLIGVKGRVLNQNNKPIANVIVEVQGRRHICPYKTNKNGEYYLLLLPGVYTLNVSTILIQLLSKILLYFVYSVPGPWTVLICGIWSNLCFRL